jgi:hypothetical protein
MTTMQVTRVPNAGPDFQTVALGVAGCFLAPSAIANFSSSDQKVWEPDGAGRRARIGVLTPDNDTEGNSGPWHPTGCAFVWRMCPWWTP